jgi:hypothetical protein
MPIDPSGINIYSPKIADEALVRKFVSQNGRGYVAVNIFDGSNSVDPDPDSISLQVWFNDISNPLVSAGNDERGTLVATVTSEEIQREDTGKYYYDIGPQLTANRGVLYARWTYSVNGVQFTFNDFLQILQQMPLYDSLNPFERSVVESVSWMFGDLFDSTEGGPYLIEPFQTHFNYERMAQMSRLAVSRLNMIGYPITQYGIGPGHQNPPPTWQGLTIFATYLEIVRHLRDSYVEIPIFQQMGVTYTDRRDYFTRWNQIWQSEWPDFQRMVKMQKRSLLNLASGSLLVHGGLYGPNAGLFVNSMYSAQVRSFRFYPAAFAIQFGSLGFG